MTWGYLKCFCWILKRSMSRLVKIPWDSHLHQKIHRSFGGVCLEGLTCYSNIIFKYFSTDSHGPHQKPWMTCYPPQKNWRPRKEESFDFEQGSDTLKISFPIIVEIWDCHRFIVFDSKAFFVTPCNAHFVAKKPRSFTTCPSNKAGIWGLLLWRCRHLGGMTHDHDDLVNDSLQSQMSHKKHQKNMGDTWLRCIPILLEPQTMYLL